LAATKTSEQVELEAIPTTGRWKMSTEKKRIQRAGAETLSRRINADTRQHLRCRRGQIMNRKTKPWARDEIPGADLAERKRTGPTKRKNSDRPEIGKIQIS
jgi:hypothetical protein